MQRFLSMAASESSELAPLSEHEVLVFLVQLVLLVGVARLVGGLFKRFGQPPVVGELVAGILLGPSVFKNLAPDVYDWVFVAEPTVNSAVFAMAWLGVIMLLVAIGFETDLAIIRRFRKAALFVSGGSLLLPMAIFIGIAFLVPETFIGANGSREIFAPFFALALSVSALPVVAKILQDLGFLRRNFGQITLAAGMTMDSIGWLLLAALSGVALQGSLNLTSLAASLAGLIVFLVVTATAGRYLIDQMFRRAMGTGSSLSAALTITLVAALIGGSVTQALKLEAILGAFIMGILLGVTRHQLPAVREILETMTAAFFAPIFFAYSGLRVDFGAFDSLAAIAWTLAIVVLAILAKLVGTYIGARGGGLEHREGLALGAGLSALGAMGIVVAIIAFNLSVVSESGFTVLVLAAVVTSVVAPLILRLVVRDWAIPEAERQRLAEESLRESSVILRTRRILLPTRGGANSVFAARLVADVFPEAEITVLSVSVSEGGLWSRVGERFRHSRDGSSDPSDVIAYLDSRGLTVRQTSRSARHVTDAIVEESNLGFDLLVLGASEDESDGTGLFSTIVDRTLSQVTIPAMVVRFPADANPIRTDPNAILVPVTRSAAARAAEEFAYSIAKTVTGSVQAMHVVTRPEGQGMMLENARVEEATDAAVAMLADAAELGAKLGVRVATSIRVARNAEEEIVATANSGEYNLLMLGTASRPLSNRAFFGHRVAYIIENASVPVVILSLPDLSFRGGARAE